MTDRSPDRGNRILDGLSAQERARLDGSLELTQLELKQRLHVAGERVEWVHFPLEGVVSQLNLVGGSSGVEVATIGTEGLVGLQVSWGGRCANPRELVQVQVPGRALRMDAERFAAEIAAQGALSAMVARYTRAFFAQVTQQVACNSLHSVTERCARWLLATHDRVSRDDFPLTQEFLAQMLGARRPTVTAAAGILSQAGFIDYRRGRLTITDREGLEGAACECYGVVRDVFGRLLP